MSLINNIIDQERQALEMTYFDKVTVYRNIDEIVGNINKKARKEVLRDKPCALSSNNKGILPNIKDINNLEGDYVLFTSEEILKGDELIITTQNGKVYNLIAGDPFDHLSHYEVPVLLKERA